MLAWLKRCYAWLIALWMRLFRSGSRALVPTQQVQPPGRLGRYRIGRALARGGHGRLFLASREAGEERFVVKAARDGRGVGLAGDAIRHEAEVLGLLRGHGVPILREAGVDAWFGRYLVMDLVEGGQLALFRPHADGIRWLRLMKRLSARLAYLHQRGVAHNDLRLENVLVDSDDRPWLIDFATARLAITDDPAASSAFAEACGEDVARLRDWVRGTPERGLSKKQLGRLKRLNEEARFQSVTAAEMTAQLARIEDGRWLRGEKRLIIRRRIITGVAVAFVLTTTLIVIWGLV